MTKKIYFVEQYLSNLKDYDFRTADTYKAIERLLNDVKVDAVSNNDHDKAKYVWCLETILSVQKKYIDSFFKMKNGKFYEAWCLLERVEINLNSLHKHYLPKDNDRYKIQFIEKHSKQFQELFPYKLFVSPAILYLEKRCSICKRQISIRNPCGHIKGEIYNGEMCLHEITQAELLELSIVDNPVQKYSVLGLDGDDSDEEFNYDYSLVEYVIKGLVHPFDSWNYQRTKISHPHSLFSHMDKDDDCPCGSGLPYKDCCLHKNGVLRPHIVFNFSVKPPIDLERIVYPEYD